MSVRRCPSCLAVVPAGEVLADSYDLVCPACQQPLQLSAASHDLSIAAGLVAAWAVWHFMTKYAGGGMLGWVLPIVCAYLALSVVSPLVLILSGDLRLRAVAPVHAETAPAAGHGAGGAHH